eukprot:SM000216S06577  [mRNA]  locus=s216:118394:122856:- [translate_table: standard]
MGVVSRRVVPACAAVTCFACPGLRSRSRRPVKRYKKFLASIFADAKKGPNERTAAKLAEYAEKNPARIPKIVEELDRRGYKDLRGERKNVVGAVVLTYSKLLSTCKEHLPLFAPNALNYIRALLQHRLPDFRCQGCELFVAFVLNQAGHSGQASMAPDALFSHNLDSLVPLLLTVTNQPSNEMEHQKERAAALHALSAMLWYLGQETQMSSYIDGIVEAVLRNYELPSGPGGAGVSDGDHFSSLKRLPSNVVALVKKEGHDALHAVKEAIAKFRKSGKEAGLHGSIHHISKIHSDVPGVWAHVCIEAAAWLAKAETVTCRQVLAPMFRFFDRGHCWAPPEHSLAFEVLKQIQDSHDKTGSGLTILAGLVRHLDLVTSQQEQVQVLELTSALAKQTKWPLRLTDVNIFGNLHMQLARSFMRSHRGTGLDTKNEERLQDALRLCINTLAKLLKDAGPVNDVLTLNIQSKMHPGDDMEYMAKATAVVEAALQGLPSNTSVLHVEPSSSWRSVLPSPPGEAPSILEEESQSGTKELQPSTAAINGQSYAVSDAAMILASLNHLLRGEKEQGQSPQATDEQAQHIPAETPRGPTVEELLMSAQQKLPTGTEKQPIVVNKQQLLERLGGDTEDIH